MDHVEHDPWQLLLLSLEGSRVEDHASLIDNWLRHQYGLEQRAVVRALQPNGDSQGHAKQIRALNYRDALANGAAYTFEHGSMTEILEIRRHMMRWLVESLRSRLTAETNAHLRESMTDLLDRYEQELAETATVAELRGKIEGIILGARSDVANAEILAALEEQLGPEILARIRDGVEAQRTGRSRRAR